MGLERAKGNEEVDYFQRKKKSTDDTLEGTSVLSVID